MLRTSICVCAYNEEQNIGRLLEVLLAQKLTQVAVADIFVVSSGSTDGTDDIVQAYCQKGNSIQLVRQAVRAGKASAINQFLKEVRTELCLLVSADIFPMPDAVERLSLPFRDSVVGMTGARIIPVNRPDSFLGFAGHMLWRMHHQIAMHHPKVGEMVAFRKVFSHIPEDIAVDEAYIESAITQAGYEILYVPQAIIYNKSPETVSDFLRQRRRIHAGHLDLRRRFRYQTSTMALPALLPVALSQLGWNPRHNLWALATMGLEAYGRFLGMYDFYIRKREHAVWEMASTTKDTATRAAP